MTTLTLILLAKCWLCPISDTIPIEQNAFNYFVSKLDSIQIFDGQHYHAFDKTKNKIYFNGHTGPSTSLNFVSLRSKEKPNFLVLDSLQNSSRKPWILPIDNQARAIEAGGSLFIDFNKFQYKGSKNHGDIKLSITNRYTLNEVYYVKITIDTGDASLLNAVYIKLDKTGTPTDYLQAYGIY